MSPYRPTQRETVPVLPPGLPYLLSILGDEDVDIHAVAAVVGRFPPIAGRLLALANSAWAAPARPVSGLPSACALLGLRVVRSVSFALAVARVFDPNRCPGFDAMNYWCTAFLTAEGAALLSPHLGEDCDVETLRTAGLLHNLGLLWLADAWPVPTSQAFQSAATDGDLCGCLRTACGTDYCEAGGMLGEAWGLPEPLTAVMRYHRDATYKGPHWRLAAASGMAASMADVLLRSQDFVPEESGTSPLNIPAAGQETVFHQMAAKQASMRELTRTLFGGHRTTRAAGTQDTARMPGDD